VTDASDEPTAGMLRARLVDSLVADRTIVSSAVEQAFRAVPRHLFAPGASLEDVYSREVVVTKRDEHGVTISSVSAPHIQAFMLEQAGVRAGMRVLEIGSGGYNAALIAEIVGVQGEVTTLDIDPDVIDRARTCLGAAGYSQVKTVLADGELGCPERAPYDRVLVTVGAWDVPPAWVGQLTGDGVLTVPLRVRGMTRSIAFGRVEEHLESQSAEVCGFVAMQGAGEHRERLLLLRDKEIGLRFDEGWPANPDLLTGALDTPRIVAWTGIEVGQEPFDSLHLWLATVLDGFCLLSVDRDLDTGLVSPQNYQACPAIVDGGTFAYLAVRKRDDDTHEFGAHAFGPDAAALVEVMAAEIRIWDRDQRRGPGPRFAAYPAGTPAEQLPDGLVVHKRHVNVLISWPMPDPRADGQVSSTIPTSKE
jgi:protein-L-isoaspartate(D-aspartate) O-methyltransferase